jgi:hypothetical protein
LLNDAEDVRIKRRKELDSMGPLGRNRKEVKLILVQKLALSKGIYNEDLGGAD